MSTLLRASSHMSQELSFHTCVAMLYSSISGSCTGQGPSEGCARACHPVPARPCAPFPHPRQQEVLVTVAKKAAGKDWVEEDYFREFTRQALC